MVALSESKGQEEGKARRGQGTTRARQEEGRVRGEQGKRKAGQEEDRARGGQGLNKGNVSQDKGRGIKQGRVKVCVRVCVSKGRQEFILRS
jgi:hypothetical protein